MPPLFWNWFASNAHLIHDAYRRDDHRWLDTHIPPRINRIGKRLNWKIGRFRRPDDLG